MIRVCLFLVAVLFLSACSDSSTDSGTTTLQTSEVQGVWVGATQNFTHIVISGSTIKGGDVADNCFVEHFSGTLTAGSNGTLTVTITASIDGPSATPGAISLKDGKLVVTGVPMYFSNEYSETYNKQSADPATELAPC